MTELESLQQLFKDVKDTDYIVKRVLEYKTELEVCEDCIHCLSTKEHALCTHKDNIQEIYNYNYMQVTLDFCCNKWEGKENES
jgi:hypothetical protein